MRTQYENSESLSNEQRAIKKFCEPHNFSWHKLPISYELDFAISKQGRLKAFAEVKCRNVMREQYPTFFIAQRKFMKGIEYTRYFNQVGGRPFVFVVIVQWKDALGYYKYDAQDKFEHDFSGRTVQTRDSADLEPMVHIPIEKFEVVGKDGAER